MKKILLIHLILLLSYVAKTENGYDLWLRYKKVDNALMLQQYSSALSAINISGTSPTMVAAKEELVKGLEGLLGKKVAVTNSISVNSIVAGTPSSSVTIRSLTLAQLAQAGEEGFVIVTKTTGGKRLIAIAANSDAGVLYGVFHFSIKIEMNCSFLPLPSIIGFPCGNLLKFKLYFILVFL